MGGTPPGGMKYDIALVPGATGNLGVSSSPWVQAMPTSSMENPQQEALNSAKEREEIATIPAYDTQS